VRGIVRKGERRSIACRKSAILVPAGNPADIRSVEDMAKPGVRVAISIIDCLKGMWEDIFGLLEFSHNVEEAKRFMDFLTTGEVRAFYREFGWI